MHTPSPSYAAAFLSSATTSFANSTRCLRSTAFPSRSLQLASALRSLTTIRNLSGPMIHLPLYFGVESELNIALPQFQELITQRRGFSSLEVLSVDSSINLVILVQMLQETHSLLLHIKTLINTDSLISQLRNFSFCENSHASEFCKVNYLQAMEWFLAGRKR